MIYVYENTEGQRIERQFPLGQAPQEVDGYQRIIVHPEVQFGVGCTRRAR